MLTSPMDPFHVSCLLLCLGLTLCGILSNGSQLNLNIDQERSLKTNSTFKTICYYAMRHNLNVSAKNPLPIGLNPMLCSHVIFIPTVISSSCTIQVREQSHSDVFTYAIPVMRKLNPKLTIMVSNAVGDGFDKVLKTSENTFRFVNSVIPFLRKYDFDGFDVDWEFPGWPITARTDGQIHNFSIVLTDLRQAFESEARQTNRTRLLLSVAVSATKEMALKIYEFEYMKKAVDFVNMMGYDYNGWGILSPFTAYNSPLHPESYDKYAFNTNNLAWGATHWGSWIGKDKVVVGIPFFCHAYKLLSSHMHGYHAFAIGKGECDHAGYTCACDALKNKNATRVFDNAAMVPYLFYGDQWVTYDDEQSIAIKTKWIMDNGFAGLMVWQMILDDYQGLCDGKTKYPLMNTVIKTISQHKN